MANISPNWTPNWISPLTDLTPKTKPPLTAIQTTIPIFNPINLRERWLLILAGAFVLSTQVGLTLAQSGSIRDFWRLIAWGISAIAGHLSLQRRLPHRDPFVFPVVMLLTGWGLVVIGRLTPAFADRQAVWILIATSGLLAVVFAPLNLRWLSRYRYLWIVSGLGLLALTTLIGRNPSNGDPRRWLNLLAGYFQPSELLKVVLIAFLASYLADHESLLDIHTVRIGWLRLPAPKFLAPPLLVWSLSVMILLWQRDLGMATLFFVILIIMMYIASGRLIYVIGGIVLLLIAAVIGYHFIDVARLRIDIWLNPWIDPKGRAFQIVQSLMAFASGGIFGQGVGQGSPGYVPIVQSDFIFAAIGEEWGLLGTLSVIMCMGVLVMRGLRIAAHAQGRPFRAFLASGISVTLAAQSLMIMGGVLKLIPLTGITLPFLSYGGSSLLTCFIMIGLLLVLSSENDG